MVLPVDVLTSGSVLATAPVASLLLLLIGLIFDRDALNAQDNEVGNDRGRFSAR